MQISVTGRQVQVSTQLQALVAERLEAVTEKYFGDAIDAQIVFGRDGQNIRCDIHIHIGAGITCQVSGDAQDLEASFELAIDRADKRLRRNKRRLRNHHRQAQPADTMPATSYVLAGEDEAESAHDGDATGAEEASPLIVAEAPMRIETLTVGNAVLRLDLADLPALMFRNRSNGRLNVVFRRSDGNIGWIDPADGATDQQSGKE